MANFKVVFEIDVEAENPLQAARTVQEWLQDSLSDWQYYVQERGDNKVVSVDLTENESEAVSPVEKYEPMIKN
jgi:hypothetical protein